MPVTASTMALADEGDNAVVVTGPSLLCSGTHVDRTPMADLFRLVVVVQLATSVAGRSDRGAPRKAEVLPDLTFTAIGR